MNIYIIRHGETDYNVERRFQGMWGESKLTERGKSQAEAAKQLIENITFDRIYSSAAIRTRETSAILFPERDDILFSDDLREIDVGSLTNRIVSQYRERMPEKFEIVDKTQGYDIFGGESCEAIDERAKSVVARILANGGEEIAVVSHGGFICHLMAALFDLPRKHFAICDNCGVSLVTVKEGQSVLAFYNRIAEESINPNGAY